jgi:nitrate reductase NapE component
MNKSKGKRQKAKGKNEERKDPLSSFLIFAFCFLPFAF